MQTEPYDIWEGLDRRSEEYSKLKEERSQVLGTVVTLAFTVLCQSSFLSTKGSCRMLHMVTLVAFSGTRHI